MPARNDNMHQQGGGVVAGVCSGLARRWGIDVGVLRFSVVALTIVTFGAFAAVYAALWLVLPPRSIDQHTVDVKPDSAASETYGDRERACDRPCAKKAKARVDYSHVPPKNPDQAATAHFEAMRAQAATCTEESSSMPVVAALAGGTVAVVLIMGFAISQSVPVFSPLQFWPLVLVGFGIMRIVVPDPCGYRMGSFAAGVVLLCAGTVLALGTTGLFVVHYREWFQEAWPLLFLAIGFMLLWLPTRSNGFALLALGLVVVFCIVAFLYCAEPGPAYSVMTGQPFAKGFPPVGVHGL